MAAHIQTAPLQPVAQSSGARWSFATRVAFRFCLVYFGLYCLLTQIFTALIPAQNIDIPDFSTLWPVRPVILWVAAHVLKIKATLVYSGSGSGDKIFDYVLLLCVFTIAIVVTAIWSALAHRENYVTLHKWFRLFIRFALAGQMLVYGMSKAIPVQMPGTFLFRLVQPFGSFSPMGVLWSSIGASRGYEIFAGCAELLGGVLLIFPRTSTLGALVCLADMTQVFMLNMTYDVPVKLASFHMLLLSLLLLAPELPRLATFFVLNRAAGPSTQPDLFETPRANRRALIAQVLFGAVLLSVNGYQFWTDWQQNGDPRPKSALYGIWNVDQMTIDGQIRSPLVNDYDRWRRVIFDLPQQIWFQRMDDSFARYGAAIDVGKKNIAMTKRDDKNWKANLSFERAGPAELALDGEMDGHRVHMELKLVDREKMLLLSRGFHWVQEYPFNR
jgi:hypothetical protein